MCLWTNGMRPKYFYVTSPGGPWIKVISLNRARLTSFDWPGLRSLLNRAGILFPIPSITFLTSKFTVENLRSKFWPRHKLLTIRFLYSGSWISFKELSFRLHINHNKITSKIYQLNEFYITMYIKILIFKFFWQLI